ncbi:MAG: FeoB-associated Cys-rich membrane protein [Dehalobacterium sp.]|jgi:hypothetical protein
MLENIIVSLIIVTILLGAITKITRDKRNGIQCSGCPHSKTCSSKAQCSGTIVNNEVIHDFKP